MTCPKDKERSLYPYSLTQGFYPDGSIRRIALALLGNLFGIDSLKMKGKVEPEIQYARDCKSGVLPCAKADFMISRDKATKVMDSIHDLRHSCQNSDLSECSYNMVGSKGNMFGSNGFNCVDFVENTAKVAGIKENIFEKLEVPPTTKSKPFEPSLFSLENKAWKYVYIKTGGKVSIRDKHEAM